jgi:uncharacterized RDD family membrane protein YckC
VARLIDHVLIGIAGALVNAIIIVAILGMDSGSFGFGGSIAASIVGAVLTTAIALGYFVFMETSQGKTLGKMVMKLRVEGPNGGNPTVEQSVKRNVWMAFPLLGVIPLIGGLIGAIGQLVAVIMIAVGISNDNVARRPWTDKLADTRVLKQG